MANVILPHTFVAGQPARASEVNANFNTVLAQLNGNIEAANLANNAVTTTKIADEAVTALKIADDSVTGAKLATGIAATKLANGSVSDAEFQYLDGVTSAIQTQLNAKQANGRYFHGRVNEDATVVVLPSGWTCIKEDPLDGGFFVLTHNLSTANYTLIVTPTGEPGERSTTVALQQSVNSCVINIYQVTTSSPTATESAFNFALFLD